MFQGDLVHVKELKIKGFEIKSKTMSQIRTVSIRTKCAIFCLLDQNMVLGVVLQSDFKSTIIVSRCYNDLNFSYD